MCVRDDSCAAARAAACSWRRVEAVVMAAAAVGSASASDRVRRPSSSSRRRPALPCLPCPLAPVSSGVARPTLSWLTAMDTCGEFLPNLAMFFRPDARRTERRERRGGKHG